MDTSFVITQIAFAITTVVFYGILVQRLNKSLKATDLPEIRKKKIVLYTIVCLTGWAILTAVMSLSGFLQDFSSLPPRLLIVLIIPLVVIIWVINTDTVRHILVHTPPDFLIRLQGFRIIVEILLWRLFVDHIAPVQMTFEGRNLDVLSGLSALLIAYLVAHDQMRPLWVIAWNILCLGLLLNIVVIAVLSMPTPFRVFLNEPANTIAAKFPVVWLPALLVPLAYGLHFLSLRQLRLKRHTPKLTSDTFSL